MFAESYLVKKAAMTLAAMSLAGATWAVGRIWSSTEDAQRRIAIVEVKQDNQAEMLKEMRSDIKELLRR